MKNITKSILLTALITTSAAQASWYNPITWGTSMLSGITSIIKTYPKAALAIGSIAAAFTIKSLMYKYHKYSTYKYSRSINDLSTLITQTRNVDGTTNYENVYLLIYNFPKIMAELIQEQQKPFEPCHEECTCKPDTEEEKMAEKTKLQDVLYKLQRIYSRSTQEFISADDIKTVQDVIDEDEVQDTTTPHTGLGDLIRQWNTLGKDVQETVIEELNNLKASLTAPEGYINEDVERTDKIITIMNESNRFIIETDGSISIVPSPRWTVSETGKETYTPSDDYLYRYWNSLDRIASSIELIQAINDSKATYVTFRRIQ